MPTPAAQIDLRVLAAISAFASKEETRYYLQGVCLEIAPDGVVYVATDGHRLAASRHGASTPNTLLGTFIIPTEFCRAIRMHRRDEPAAILTGKGLDLEINWNRATTPFQAIDGTYPDWRRVVPTGEASGKAAQIDGNYAASIHKLGDMLDIGRPYFAHDGDTGAPVLCRFAGDPHTFAVVMSIRVDLPFGAMPAWALPPVTKAEKPKRARNAAQAAKQEAA